MVIRHIIKHTSLGWRRDQIKRSRQNWERGSRARKIGNPRYKPVQRKGRKVYILRNK